MTYTKEQIDRANQTDLVSFLQAQGEQLERAGQEYRWKRHDSLTVYSLRVSVFSCARLKRIETSST